jgi:hypothetical protein
VIESLYDIELVFKHVQTAGEVSIWSEKSVFFEFVQSVYLDGVVFVIFGRSEDFTECAATELLADYIIADDSFSLLVFPLFDVVTLFDEDRDLRFGSLPERRLFAEVGNVVIVRHVGVFFFH